MCCLILAMDLGNRDKHWCLKFEERRLPYSRILPLHDVRPAPQRKQRLADATDRMGTAGDVFWACQGSRIRFGSSKCCVVLCKLTSALSLARRLECLSVPIERASAKGRNYGKKAHVSSRTSERPGSGECWLEPDVADLHGPMTVACSGEVTYPCLHYGALCGTL
jgi:hypothetical protein